MKKITEPFDLDKYNNQSGYKAEFQNENAYTFPAKIIYTKCKGTHPIVAVISLFPNTEEVLNFTLEGQFSNNNCTSHLCLVKYEFEVGDIVTFPLMKEERVVGKVKRVEEDNIVVECDETEYQLFDKSRVRKATLEEKLNFNYRLKEGDYTVVYDSPARISSIHGNDYTVCYNQGYSVSYEHITNPIPLKEIPTMLPFMAGDFVTLFLNGKNKVIKLSKDFQYGDNVFGYDSDVVEHGYMQTGFRYATTEEIVLFEYMSGNRSKFEVLEFLCQKRDDFNFNWKPNYTAEDTKYSITAREYTLVKDVTFNYHRIFAFKSKDTCDKFFDKYYDLLKVIIEFL